MANLPAVFGIVNAGAGGDERLKHVVCDLLLDAAELLRRHDRLDIVAEKVVGFIRIEPFVSILFGAEYDLTNDTRAAVWNMYCQRYSYVLNGYNGGKGPMPIGSARRQHREAFDYTLEEARFCDTFLDPRRWSQLRMSCFRV